MIVKTGRNYIIENGLTTNIIESMSVCVIDNPNLVSSDETYSNLSSLIENAVKGTISATKEVDNNCFDITCTFDKENFSGAKKVTSLVIYDDNTDTLISRVTFPEFTVSGSNDIVFNYKLYF